MPTKAKPRTEEPALERDILVGSKPVDVPSKSVTAASVEVERDNLTQK